MNIVILYAGSGHVRSLLDRCLSLDATPILLKSDTPADIVASYAPDGIIISGSPRSVFDPKCPLVDPAIYHMGTTPVLGICYGMQRMAMDLGGEAVRFPSMEKERVLLSLEGDPSVLYDGFTDAGVDVWMSHSVHVRELPDGFVRTGSTDQCFFASMERDHLFAVQFHPEKDGMGSGKQILNNFFSVCG